MSRFIAAALLVLVCLAASPPAAVVGYDLNRPGPWRIGFTHIDPEDAARSDRLVPMDIFYPVDEEDWVYTNFNYSLLAGFGPKVPKISEDADVSDVLNRRLIVFSHGYGGIALQSTALMEHLASHGFIVVAPSHTGNTQTDNSATNPENDRLPDISFVIDTMAAKSADAGDAFFGHVYTNHVGVAGHSFGGMTAMFTATGFNGVPPDSRVAAIFPIAASSSFLTDPEIASISIPTLFLVGTLDSLQAETIRSYGLISHKPDTFRADVTGANHTHFANVCQIGDWLIETGNPIESWGDLGAGALVPIYEATCIPPALSIGIAQRLQSLYASSFFLFYLADAGYGGFLREDYGNVHEPHVTFWGNTSVPIPALPDAGFYALLGFGPLTSGAILVRRRRVLAEVRRPRD